MLQVDIHKYTCTNRFTHIIQYCVYLSITLILRDHRACVVFPGGLCTHNPFIVNNHQSAMLNCEIACHAEITYIVTNQRIALIQ